MKPYIMHKLHGTDRARVRKRIQGTMAAREDDLRPLGDPPDFLQGDALEEWARIKEWPALRASDRCAVIEYCILYARMIEDGKGGKPMMATQRQALNSIRIQLGLTPFSRSRVKVPEVKAKADVQKAWDALG